MVWYGVLAWNEGLVGSSVGVVVCGGVRYWCGGVWWCVVVCGGLMVLWCQLLVVVCGGVWWCAVVSRGVWWCAVMCGDVWWCAVGSRGVVVSGIGVVVCGDVW